MLFLGKMLLRCSIYWNSPGLEKQKTNLKMFWSNIGLCFFRAMENKKSDCSCRGLVLGQSFVSSDSKRCLFQDEDHSGSRPQLFPGLCRMRSGTSPERFRSSPELAGS